MSEKERREMREINFYEKTSRRESRFYAEFYGQTETTKRHILKETLIL